jgi:hypothetical protein
LEQIWQVDAEAADAEAADAEAADAEAADAEAADADVVAKFGHGIGNRGLPFVSDAEISFASISSFRSTFDFFLSNADNASSVSIPRLVRTRISASNTSGLKDDKSVISVLFAEPG